MNLKNKIYIVTGGSSGIGKAIVDELLINGAIVVNADVNKLELETSNYLFVKTDMTNENEINDLVKITLEKFNQIDGVINNAGINIPSLLADKNNLHELNSNMFDKIFNINVKGVILLSQKVAHHFIEKNEGVIINMGSECGLEGSEGQSIYAASKAAIYSLTRSWAKELGKYNIRVIGVAPGVLEETGLRTLIYEEGLAYTRGISVEQLREGYGKISVTPLGRAGKLSEVADLVLYLLSNKSTYITGTTINIAGGKTRG